MSRNDIPEPWRTALERKGIGSIRGLAAKAGISPMAASRLVKGQGTSVETINAVAWFVFEDDVEYVWKLRGLNVRDLGRFELPEEASLLTNDQRAALVALVRSMLPEAVKAAIAGAARETIEPRLDARSRRELETYRRAQEQAAVRRRHKPDEAPPADAPDAESSG